jgi:hypothetical protein
MIGHGGSCRGLRSKRPKRDLAETNVVERPLSQRVDESLFATKIEKKTGSPKT